MSAATVGQRWRPIPYYSRGRCVNRALMTKGTRGRQPCDACILCCGAFQGQSDRGATGFRSGCP